MLTSKCACGTDIELSESSLGQPTTCPACNTTFTLLAAEPTAGDVTARLTITAGPAKVGHLFLLAGEGPIEIGKLPGKHILLSAANVSRNHARLVHTGTHWRLADAGSTNGVLVNGRKVKSQDLSDGDKLQIGDFTLAFHTAHAPAPVANDDAGLGLGALEDAAEFLSLDPIEEPTDAAPAAQAQGEDLYDFAEEPAEPVHRATPAHVANFAAVAAGPVLTCPACKQQLSPGAKICVACGIDARTGRPLITAKGFDEDELQEKAWRAIRIISWFIPVGLYPVASEGFGVRKPITLWVLVALTCLISLLVLAADMGNNPLHDLSVASNFELWAGDPAVKQKLPDIALVRHLSPAQRDELERRINDRPKSDFAPYQLLTYAFLHGGLMHLAGNMLFMIVLGVSVNSLIGNLQTAIVYPILAVAGGVAHYLASMHNPVQPMLGASGAIMGLAGMYLVLFPVHKMYMAAWWRWGLFRGFKLSWKVWPVRGFWVVLFYISFDVAFTAFGVHDSTAHWCHLGGFMAGVVVAVLLLVTRQVDARGGDILTALLGTKAWALIGKPTDRHAPATVLG